MVVKGSTRGSGAARITVRAKTTILTDFNDDVVVGGVLAVGAVACGDVFWVLTNASQKHQREGERLRVERFSFGQ